MSVHLSVCLLVCPPMYSDVMLSLQADRQKLEGKRSLIEDIQQMKIG